MPVNAVQRRRVPENAGRLRNMICDAMPLLLRSRVLDAVLAAQTHAGAPVTSQQARAASPTRVLGHARAFTEVAAAIARLGPDAGGRVLVAAGTDRKGVARWWVEEQRAAGA